MSSDSRRVRRHGFADIERIAMLEDDADDTEGELHAFRVEMKEELKWIRRTLIAFLAAIPMATIGICVTIVLTR